MAHARANSSGETVCDLAAVETRQLAVVTPGLITLSTRAASANAASISRASAASISQMVP